jgi:hypothetical protein
VKSERSVRAHHRVELGKRKAGRKKKTRRLAFPLETAGPQPGAAMHETGHGERNQLMNFNKLCVARNKVAAFADHYAQKIVFSFARLNTNGLVRTSRVEGGSCAEQRNRIAVEQKSSNKCSRLSEIGQWLLLAIAVLALLR